MGGGVNIKDPVPIHNGLGMGCTVTEVQYNIVIFYH